MEDVRMRRMIAPSVVAVIALISATAMAGDLKSGLQVGESAGAYNVKDCTGPAQGKTLCYR
jgi:ABC-type methionine transport system permease subunit